MTTPERLHHWYEFTAQSALLAIAAAGYFLVPPGPGRAVLVLPAIIWIPGRALVVRFGLERAAGVWAVPLAAILSIVALIAAALLVYAVHRHVDFGVLPLWVSLAALQLTAWRRPGKSPATLEAPDPSATGLPTGSLLRSGAVLLAGTAAAAAIVTEVYHVMPTAQQPGYLAFAYAAPYSGVAGVLDATPGERLEIPFTVEASRADTSGLTVSASADAGTGTGTAHTAPVTFAPTATAAPASGASTASGTSEQHGTARVAIHVPDGCLTRYTFTLERSGTPLRTLDLYFSTDRTAACHG